MPHLIAVAQASASWGTVPDWVTSIGTILAFGLAFFLALREAHFRNIATRDDEMRQARLIIVEPPTARRATTDEDMAIFVPVNNYSQQPIQNLIVGLLIGRRSPDKDESHDDHMHDHEEPEPYHRHVWATHQVRRLESSNESEAGDSQGTEAHLQPPELTAYYHEFDFLGPGEKEEFEFIYPPGEGGVVSDSPAIWFLDASG
jgi:hypothetical protein